MSRTSGTRLTRIVLEVVGIATAYAILARLGLLLDAVAGFATLVWAPTGLAIAAVLLLGSPVLAGVWLGALVANVMSGAPLLTAMAIATGNSLEAALAVWLLGRFRSFDPLLRRLSDVLTFAVVGALLAPVVSATIGVGALVSSGILAGARFLEAWQVWYVGDCIGALLVAPAVLVWRARGWRDLGPRMGEAGAILLALIAVASVVFFADTPLGETSFLQAYLVFPVLIWASVRFEQRGAVTTILLTSVVAIIGTAGGSGPFVEGQLRDSLFTLQTFMGIVAISFLALSAAIVERGEALRTARALLETVGEANRAKSDFLAAMSHELRTPLNAIGGYSQLLAMEVHGTLTPQQRDALARIDSNHRHLSSLVADVLSFARVESGHLTLAPAAISVPESLAALTQFVSPEAERKNVALAILPAAEPLFVHADPERLRQILLNLVVNAIKFSEPGGRVELSASALQRQVRIVVRDHGIGIPGEELERVFEPFFQVEHGSTRRHPGVGLGLTISRDLARAMGGDILIESERGRGTTAIVLLPMAEPPATASSLPGQDSATGDDSLLGAI